MKLRAKEESLHIFFFLSYSHARKQSILKEMLSREIAEPGPGPSSVLNCSQNLRRDGAVLTTSQPVNGWMASEGNYVGIYRALRKMPSRFVVLYSTPVTARIAADTKIPKQFRVEAHFLVPN